MREQLLAKDKIIAVQERKISGLVEANATLRSGLQDLLSLPKDASESEGEDERERLRHSPSEAAYANGHLSPAAHSADLHRMISLLGSGQFDQS